MLLRIIYTFSKVHSVYPLLKHLTAPVNIEYNVLYTIFTWFEKQIPSNVENTIFQSIYSPKEITLILIQETWKSFTSTLLPQILQIGLTAHHVSLMLMYGYLWQLVLGSRSGVWALGSFANDCDISSIIYDTWYSQQSQTSHSESELLAFWTERVLG